MTRVVFSGGQICDFWNVDKIYVEKEDCLKMVPVNDIINCEPIDNMDILNKIKSETADNPVISVDFVGDCDTCIFSDACIPGEEMCKIDDK